MTHFIRLKVWKVIQWFLFRLDAEAAHRITVRLIRFAIYFRRVPLRLASGVTRIEEFGKEQSVFPKVLDMDFKSRVGLAAGFDKNAEILTALPALGYGFAEIGTVTPRPQPGNDRPRLFRDYQAQALFNRMGFNGLGAEIVSSRLRESKEKLPLNFRVGVNLGKNKDTPLENAWEDYVRAAQPFEGLADYLVINISSPNTPGLRSLQSLEALKPIVTEVSHLIAKWKTKTPLLIKVAPEVHGIELAHLITEVECWGVDGWVLTNTLGGAFKHDTQEVTGGWSGKPLTQLSRRSLLEARRVTQKPIISVGGILTSDDALVRISEGADLIQVYTGWVFQGPTFPRELAQRIQNCQPGVQSPEKQKP